MAGGILFGFLAGVFSTLSPCVLPLLPLVLGAAVAAHRFGMVALAAGMVLSFVAAGMFVATIGFSIGLTANLFRDLSAVVLGLIGLVLLSGALQQRFALAASGLGNAGNRLITKLAPSGLSVPPGPFAAEDQRVAFGARQEGPPPRCGGVVARFRRAWHRTTPLSRPANGPGRTMSGQFVIGLILGAIWSPCVGPTLGAASLLASRGQNLPAVAAVMLAFGLGAALPLILIGSLSREALGRWRGRLLNAGAGGKYVLGLGALAISALILSGLDRGLETVLVGLSPDWLTDLTTRF